VLVIIDHFEVKKATRRKFFLKHFTRNGGSGEYFRVGGRGRGRGMISKIIKDFGTNNCFNITSKA